MTTKTNFARLAGSWIVDAGPGQMKVFETYIPIGEGKFTATGMGFNFNWTLGGAKPTATHGTTQCGVVEVVDGKIVSTLLNYALDDKQRAVYILKAVGSKTLKDDDTILVENLVFHFYNDPETANPITDPSDFTVPASGTFPPVHEYRIKNSA
jgi:hypothetical protein